MMKITKILVGKGCTREIEGRWKKEYYEITCEMEFDGEADAAKTLASEMIHEWLQKSQSSSIPKDSIPENKVPMTKEPLKDSKIKQIPLVQGNMAIGMLNLLKDGSEISIVPEKSILIDDPTIAGFLIPRILDKMTENQPSLEYQLVGVEKGVLKAILIRGKLDDNQVKELINASRWAFSKAMERSR